jgi:hypothetical protein
MTKWEKSWFFGALLFVGIALLVYYSQHGTKAVPIDEASRSLPLVTEGIDGNTKMDGVATVIGEAAPIPGTSLFVVRLQQDDPAKAGQESTMGALVGADQKPKPGERIHWRFVTWYNHGANARDPIRIIDGPAQNSAH